jgi:hypothetical protein
MAQFVDRLRGFVFGGTDFVQIPQCEGFVQGVLNMGLKDDEQADAIDRRLHV